MVELYERGRAAHPSLPLPEAAFIGHLTRVMERAHSACPASLEIEDLYLAAACIEGVRGAVPLFDKKFSAVIRRAVGRVVSTAADTEETQQRTRDHLLVGRDGKLPKLARYAARGPLERWIAVAATRVAVSFGRSESAERRLRQKVAIETVGVDPELDVMKGQLRVKVESAIVEALASLGARDRLVLRLHLVSGMSLTAIGKSFGVSQQAVSLWLSAARDRILGSVRSALHGRPELAGGDLTSIIHLVASRLELSVSRLLRPV